MIDAAGDDRVGAGRGPDTIDCGVGTDTALLDFKDVIADATAQNPNGSCEVVNRERRLKKGQDSPENAGRGRT